MPCWPHGNPPSRSTPQPQNRAAQRWRGSSAWCNKTMNDILVLLDGCRQRSLADRTPNTQRRECTKNAQKQNKTTKTKQKQKNKTKTKQNKTKQNAPHAASGHPPPPLAAGPCSSCAHLGGIRQATAPESACLAAETCQCCRWCKVLTNLSLLAGFIGGYPARRDGVRGRRAVPCLCGLGLGLRHLFARRGGGKPSVSQFTGRQVCL